MSLDFWFRSWELIPAQDVLHTGSAPKVAVQSIRIWITERNPVSPSGCTRYRYHLREVALSSAFVQNVLFNIRNKLYCSLCWSWSLCVKFRLLVSTEREVWQACKLLQPWGTCLTLWPVGCALLTFWQDHSHHSTLNRAYTNWASKSKAFPNRPWGPSSLLFNGYRISFPAVKRLGRGVEQPPRLGP
jgi:hypothetical protein